MKEELFLSNGALVAPEVWADRITGIKKSVKEDLTNRPKAVKAVSESVLAQIIDRVSNVPKTEHFGVMFSGGVDSTFIAFIAKRVGREFTCYTLGFKEDETKQPEDVDAAIEAAKLIGVQLKHKVISISESERIIKKTVKILGPELSNVVNVGVGTVVVACVELAEKDGVKYLFSGLGSEEVFAGYERHRKSTDINVECWNGLFNMYERDLLRDYAISKATGMNFLTPLLAPEVITVGMSVPSKFKVDSETSKIILREVAEAAGLPKSIAWRKKRAAQYGSRMDSAIDKLARKNGFEFKKDYLASLSSKK